MTVGGAGHGMCMVASERRIKHGRTVLLPVRWRRVGGHSAAYRAWRWFMAGRRWRRRQRRTATATRNRARSTARVLISHRVIVIAGRRPRVVPILIFASVSAFRVISRDGTPPISPPSVRRVSLRHFNWKNRFEIRSFEIYVGYLRH